MFQALGAGFVLAISLIMAIGAQNAFVLRQGISGQHVGAVVLACGLSDAILITLGIGGFGVVMARWPVVEPILLYGGVAFLIVYGLRSLISAFRSNEGLDPSARQSMALWPTVLTVLALTWLNPHVYLDPVVLLGSISTGYPDHKIAFGAGAIAGSFVFFTCLGFGASLLRPFFANPRAWRVLDLIVALIMFSVAAGLLLSR